MRSNPRKVKKPVIKKWCYTPTEESGLSTDDQDETTTVAAAGGDDETTTEAGTEAAAAGVTEQTDAETEAPSTETTGPETEGDADPLAELRASFNGGGRFQNRRKSRQL